MLAGLDLDDLDITVAVDDEDGDDADDAGEADFDLDLEVADEAEGDEEEESGDMEASDDDEVLEIDEAVLRSALAEMKQAKSSPRRRRRNRRLSEDAAGEADHFGGAEVMGDVIEVDEDVLINVLADELGRVADNGAAAPAVVESRRRPSRRSRPQKTNKLRNQGQKLAEAARDNKKLKKQLQEMNLFSAKLLYVNKIFSGKNVTAKQRRAIVEAMDNAKTLREAKLLYSSIRQSFNKKTKDNTRLSENRVRVLGSSSRTTPSAQPANNGVEVDRWAALAGLGENK